MRLNSYPSDSWIDFMILEINFSEYYTEISEKNFIIFFILFILMLIQVLKYK